MEIHTARFGTVDVSQNQIITFNEGIPGFEDEKEFFFFDSEETRPLVWMQSVTTEHIALPVVNPFIVKEDYALDIRDSEVAALKIKDDKQVFAWVVAILPEDITKMTVNLSAPIIINLESQLGMQFVTDVKEYDSRYPAFQALVKQLAEGGATDAGTI